MLQVRKSNDRGHSDHGWLKSQFSFSFADYYDPENMGFKSLRVINEDHIQGGTGFGAHLHRDMEIITYVIKGALEHKDSMGTTAVVKPGEVQRMSAGRGVVHSEHSKSEDETHLFQIWIMPEAGGGTPGYEQKSFEKDLKEKNLVLVVSHDGRDGSLSIKQDANLFISRLKPEEVIDFPVREDRGVYLHVVKGSVHVGDKTLSQGDALAVDEEQILKLKALAQAELLIFDLA
jgi:quercetin 2,3-dioxygenase